MKNILLCGSIAMDTILYYEGAFKDSFDGASEKRGSASASFLTPQMRKEFGGCAANIAYALTQMGMQPTILGTVGKDGTAYIERMQSWGLDCKHVLQLDTAFTAQAAMLTDNAGDQIIAFHPGAMNEAHTNAITADLSHIDLAILSPDGKQATLDHAVQLNDLGIPFIFDPGQGLGLFDAEELRTLIGQAHWVIVNEAEADMLEKTSGWQPAELAEQLSAYIVTLGSQGCAVWEHKATSVQSIAASKAQQEVDPTGCGDAFRGGLLYGMAHDWDLQKSCELANRIGAHKVAFYGAQNYDLKDFTL